MQKTLDHSAEKQSEADPAPALASVATDGAPAPETQQAEGKAGAAAILRMAETNLAGAWRTVHDAVINGAAESIGWAEMLGLRYPVKSYEASVDGSLYRGSRVDMAAMTALHAQGIKGIVNLCAENNSDEPIARKLGMTPHHIPIMDNTAPTVSQMRDFVAFASSTTPCYVHCEAGKGRTGTAVACYRIVVSGWTAEQAIAEGRTFGLALPNQIHFIERFAVTEGAKGAHQTASASSSAPLAAPPPA